MLCLISSNVVNVWHVYMFVNRVSVTDGGARLLKTNGLTIVDIGQLYEHSKGVFIWRRASPPGKASPTKTAGFHLAFTWEKPALLPRLTSYIYFPTKPGFDICVQVFILYPTHKQTELVK